MHPVFIIYYPRQVYIEMIFIGLEVRRLIAKAFTGVLSSQEQQVLHPVFVLKNFRIEFYLICYFIDIPL